MLSAPNGRLVATRPGEGALEVGQVPTPEVVDLSARGSVVSDMNTGDLATAVGMPDVDPEAPPTLDEIRQWMVSHLFGPVSPGRIQQLPWAHLGGGTAELLDDPGFDAASTFNSGDPNITRNAEFGRSKPGSAEIVANGVAHLVVSNLIAVEQGEKLPVGAWVFYEELAASAAPVRVSVRAYHRAADDSLTLLSTAQVAALTATSGESADHPDQDDDWVWLGATYTVPGPVGGLPVTDVVLEVKVTEDATGGTINVDDATVTKTRDGMPQDWILDLVPDLSNLGDWIEEVVDKALEGLGIPPIGSLFDKMLDFQDGLADLDNMAGTAWTNANNALTDLANKLGISDWDDWLADATSGWQALLNKFKGGTGATLNDIPTALNNAGQGVRDAIVQALGGTGTGHTAADVLAALQNIPKAAVDGLTDLSTQSNQIIEILAGNVVTPIDSAVQAVKDWWNSWFGGGSSNAIPLSQKGAINGVAPLDGNRLIPSIYIPASSGGGGESVPNDHILFTLPADQNIPSGAATALTGWEQAGSLAATFDDGTNTRFTLPKTGWWDIQSQVVWESSTTGKRQSAIRRTLSSGSVVPATDGADASDNPSWGVRNKIRDLQEVGVRDSLAATDKFSIEAFQNSGGALDVVAGYPDGTYVLAVYIGQEEEEFNPNAEENVARTNAPVSGGASGCWVTLGGGGGGGGAPLQTGSGRGGGGGGSGAVIPRVWIPIAALGADYSVVVGSQGATGANGGASQFSSGSITLTAGGGSGGASGTAGGAAGSGGTASATGFSAATTNGNAGTAGTSGSGSSTQGIGGSDPGGLTGCNGGDGGYRATSGVSPSGSPGQSGYTLIEWE